MFEDKKFLFYKGKHGEYDANQFIDANQKGNDSADDANDGNSTDKTYNSAEYCGNYNVDYNHQNQTDNVVFVYFCIKRENKVLICP